MKIGTTTSTIDPTIKHGIHPSPKKEAAGQVGVDKKKGAFLRSSTAPVET
jgi:hypothetical protein